jgi:hypothetical protein
LRSRGTAASASATAATSTRRRGMPGVLTGRDKPRVSQE